MRHSKKMSRNLAAAPHAGHSAVITVHVPDRPRASTSSISEDEGIIMGPKMPRDGTQQLAAPFHLERWGIDSFLDISAGIVHGGRSSKALNWAIPKCTSSPFAWPHAPLECSACPGMRGREGEGETKMVQLEP